MDLTSRAWLIFILVFLTLGTILFYTSEVKRDSYSDHTRSYVSNSREPSSTSDDLRIDVLSIVGAKIQGIDKVPTKKMVETKRDANWKKNILQYFSNQGCIVAPSDFCPPSWLEQMVILIGVQKGGTKALFSFLQEHPSVVSRCSDDARKTEIFFFDNRTLLYDQIDQQELQIQYSKHVQSKCPLAVSSLEEDSTKIFLDDSPGYMLESHQVPKLLNCVLLNSKIIALIRDPTARAFSHYNFYVNRNLCTEFTFEEWVEMNIKDLKDAGIMDATDPYEELLAWRKYNDDPIHRKLRNCNSFVTRGLYTIELLHYMTALIASGRPKSDLHVIISENLRGDTRQDEYNSLLQFLGLESHEILHNGDVHATDYETTMKESTRVKLDQFFRPYNARLYRMMGWNPIWNADSSKKCRALLEEYSLQNIKIVTLCLQS